MNVELAERAIKVARANPHQFDMEDWVTGNNEGFTKDTDDTMPPCGTVACYAGWVSFLAAPARSEVIGSFVHLPDGQKCHVGDYAREALGITEGQEEALFYLYNLEQVERAVRYLAGNPDASLREIREQVRTGDQ